MEASALPQSAALPALAGRSPLLRLQTDERLIALTRRGHNGAFEALVHRYQPRLLAFCRHMLGSQEDAEDVLQEVFTAAFNAIRADDRPINARPWLYRIARNRCLNHLRKPTADGVDSMDVHVSENGTSTLERVQRREELRAIVADVQELPETQRTALVLREIDDLSYTDIAQAMGTTLPSVKSLLVRARMSLAESSEARILTCDEVRLELAEAAEGLRKLAGSSRRHISGCPSCTRYREELRSSTKALSALAPFGLLAFLKKLIPAKLKFGGGSSAGSSAGAGGGTAGSVGTAGSAAGTASGVAGTAGSVAAAGSSGLTLGGVVSAAGTAATGIGGALGAKAAVGLATAALITAGAVSVEDVDIQSPAPAAPVASAAAIGNPGALVAAAPVLPAAPIVAEVPPAPPIVEAAPPAETVLVEAPPPVEPPPVEPAPVEPAPVVDPAPTQEACDAGG